MPSLPQLLQEASARAAEEIVLETGRPPTIRTQQGTDAIGDALRESDLFEALTQVLPPEQQAELAVGNVVEFELPGAEGTWTLVTEPGPDGIVVRGRRRAAPAYDDEIGMPLDLPPLEPFQPNRPSPLPGSIPRASAAETGPPSVAARPSPSPPRARASPPPSDRTVARAQRPTAHVPSSSSSSAAAGQQRSTMHDGAMEEIPLLTGIPPGSETELEAVGVGLDDDPAVELIDLDPPPDEGPDPISVSLDDPETVGGPVAAPQPESAPAKRRAAVPSTHSPTATAAAFEPSVEVSLVGDSQPAPERSPNGLGAHAAALEPGTVCFLQGDGFGETLAGYIGAPVATVEDTSSDARLADMARDLGEGSTAVVKLEDPSAKLGWILRRLEEGWRVVVETRATTPQGARRVLLGPTATERAEAWLACHPQVWLSPEGGAWRLEPVR